MGQFQPSKRATQCSTTLLALLATTVLSYASSFRAAPPTSAPASQPEAEREGNRLKATPNDIHGLFVEHRFDRIETDSDGNLTGPGVSINLTIHHYITPNGGLALHVNEHTSEVIDTPFPFNDVVPSFNVDVPEGAGFIAQLRVGRHDGDFWSPFYYLGMWGDAPNEVVPTKLLNDSAGEINIDYFQSGQTFDRMQYRFVLFGPAERSPQLKRVSLAYSNTLNDEDLARKLRKEVDPGPKEKWARRLPVPYRSQKWENEGIRGQICSPTSTSMVLEYRGVKKPTVEVCKRIFDPEYHLYGNWWRAVQGAYSFGVSGYIERFGDFNAVKRHIADGQPVIASIKVKKGQLRSAPYRETAGHLLVITGFTDSGDICINDPAASDAEHGITTYAREDMEKIWLANGGIGYILEPVVSQ